MSERTASAGEWIAVVGESVTLVLPAGERARAGALWPLVDDGVDLVTVLDALLADGLSTLEGFVLVETEGDRAHVLVRGEAVVTAHSPEGQVRVRSGDRLWAEDDFSGIVALVAELPGEVAGNPVDRVVLRPGLTRVGGLTWGSVPELARPAQSEAPAQPAEPAVHRVIEPVIAPIPPAPSPEVPPARTPPVVPPVPPVQAAPPASEEEPLETVPLSAMPLAPDWQEEVTSHVPVEEGGLSVLGFGVPDESAAELPAAGTQHPPVALLVFNHGATVPVDGPLLVGRGPTARAGSPGARLVTVPSPHQEVSGTHVEIRPGEGLDLGTAVVTDLGSTNGTVVAQPGLSSEELRPGSPVSLLPGAVIDLGDGVTIEVRRP